LNYTRGGASVPAGPGGNKVPLYPFRDVVPRNVA